jgi:hypothetical protein
MTAEIVLAIAAVAVLWACRLAAYPWGPCRSCQGRKGHGTGSTRRAWNRCGRCGGTGERPRPGARAIRRAIGRPID